MIYRKAKINDVENINIIHKELFPNEKANASNQINNPNYRVFVATDTSDQVLGYITYQVIDDEAEVYFFGIKEELQGQKIGQEILDFSIKELKKEKVNRISLEVRGSNLAARRIYEKSGFINVGVRIRYYTDNYEDAIVYIWEDKTKW